MKKDLEEEVVFECCHCSRSDLESEFECPKCSFKFCRYCAALMEQGCIFCMPRLRAFKCNFKKGAKE